MFQRKIVIALLAGLAVTLGAFGGALTKVSVSAEEPSPGAPVTLEALRNADDADFGEWARLPSFDGRELGYIGAVENQFSTNLCWAYATLAASEASILREGLDGPDPAQVNLDPYNVAYQVQNMAPDPLGNTLEDRAPSDGGNAWNVGGWPESVAYTFSQWRGPGEISTTVAFNQYKEPAYLLEDAIFLQNDEAQIKDAVLRYGGVAFAYYSEGQGNSVYYNSSASYSSLHACAIIGWDDTVDKNLYTGARGSLPASQNGGWIVKNSWGPLMGKGGYFYLSYDSPLSALTAFDFTSREEYDNNYHYDGGNVRSGETSVSVWGNAQAAAIFEAKTAYADTREFLKGVQVGVMGEGVTLTVKIYKEVKADLADPLSANNDPTAGVPVKTVKRELVHGGLYTVELGEELELGVGECFSVVALVENEAGDATVRCTHDYRSENDMTYFFRNGTWQNCKELDYTNSCVARIKAFTVNKARTPALSDRLENATIRFPAGRTFVFDGAIHKPSVEVWYNGAQLAEGKDYVLTYENLFLAGYGKVTAEGIGKFSGSYKSAAFFTRCADAPPNRPNYSFYVLASAYRVYGEVPLPQNWEWDEKDRPVSDGAVTTIRYTGAEKESYRNVAADARVMLLGGSGVSLAGGSAAVSGNYVYTGFDIMPAVEVKTADGKLLSVNSDYFVTYEKNVRPGTAVAVVTGIGNYTGTLRAEFEIREGDIPVPPDPIPISSCEISLAAEPLVYTGKELFPAVSVRRGGEALTDADYELVYENNVNAGRGKVTVYGKGNYAGSAEKYFDILPADLSGGEALVSGGFVYTGEEILPAVTVRLGGKTLLPEDYELTFSDNLNAGNALFVVRGKGNYTGTLEGVFTISPAELSEGELNVENAQYTGEELFPAFTATWRGRALTEADFDAVYSNNTDAGAGKLVLTGKGNFTGTLEGVFTISPADLSEGELNVENAQYTGEALFPAFTATWRGRALTEADFDAVYSNNTDAGAGKLVLTGKGNFTGTLEGVFTISPADLSEGELNVENAQYTGEALFPAFTATWRGRALTQADFDAVYSNNTDAGAGKLVLTGKGNFAGTLEGVFTISPAELPEGEIVLLADGEPLSEPYRVVYDGAEHTLGATVRGAELSLSCDRVQEPGDYEILVTAHGNYTGSARLLVTVFETDKYGKALRAKLGALYACDADVPFTAEGYAELNRIAALMQAFSEEELARLDEEDAARIEAYRALLTRWDNAVSGAEEAVRLAEEVGASPIDGLFATVGALAALLSLLAFAGGKRL